MNFLLGLDPGGIGNFGWCITRDSSNLPVTPIASGLSDSASQAIKAALAALPVGHTLCSAGIDAPLYWSRAGSRVADELVRTAIRSFGAPQAAGTVQGINSLRGACLVQGMLAAIELREKFPLLLITEAHPKALRWLLPEVAAITSNSEHERDAMLASIAAWAALHQPAGWSDLLGQETNVYSPLQGHLIYIVPNVTCGDSFRRTQLSGAS
jgi:hypothetical protein